MGTCKVSSIRMKSDESIASDLEDRTIEPSTVMQTCEELISCRCMGLPAGYGAMSNNVSFNAFESFESSVIIPFSLSVGSFTVESLS